jgi:hypothetical protein
MFECRGKKRDEVQRQKVNKLGVRNEPTETERVHLAYLWQVKNKNKLNCCFNMNRKCTELYSTEVPSV